MKTIPLLLFGLSLYLVATTPAAASTDQWTTPTPEELAMTAIPQVPGANAVLLYKEQVADSREHTILYYYRIKILSDKGKDFANVELPYSGDNAVKVDQIAGRTIHPDGSIVPFTGKPFERVVEKTKGYKLTQKLFSLPAVELGSIIEYRYRENYASYLGIDEDWYGSGDVGIDSW